MPSRFHLSFVAALAGGLLLSGCGPGGEKTAEAPAAPQPTLHEVMTTSIAPQAQVLWDVPGKALDNDGNVDGSLLTADDWTQILAAGTQMRDAADMLSKMQNIKVPEEGVTLAQEENPGAAKAPDVQRYIDADPVGFSRQWADLHTLASEFVTAAEAKNGKRLGEASDKLDQACEACHVKFWYPEQEKAAQEAQRKN